jgi:tetratricopeptide (TPR) repeat protein
MRTDFSDVHHKIKVYQSLGRYEAAEKLLLATLEEHGPLANIHNLLGLVFYKQNKVKPAIEQFATALRINPEFVESALNLSIALSDIGRYEEARAIFGSLTSYSKNPASLSGLALGRLANLHVQSGRLYEQCGMVHDAVAEYRKALALYSNLPDVRLTLGRMYLRQQRFEEAFTELQAALAERPLDKDVLLCSAISAMNLNKPVEAKRLLEALQTQGGQAGETAVQLMKSLNGSKNLSR